MSNYRAVRIAGFIGMSIIVLLVFIIFGLPLLRIAKDIIFGPISVVSVLLPTTTEIKSSAGRTNVLLLGIGGGKHDGPNLSDSMLVLSIKTKFENENEKVPPVILISLPRDIYLESLGEKINFAYAKGAEKNKSSGLALAKATVSQVTGLPIHYAVVGDFSAFEKTVDLLGGIDVDVKKRLEDKKYPLPLTKELLEECDGKDEEDPCWYETLTFERGMTHMDGQTALKFVRSRHAEGSEGTDFARATRQQQVITAVKDKFFSTQTFLNPSKIEQVYNLLKSHIYTDADPAHANLFLRMALKYKGAQFKNVVLGENVFVNPPIDERGWILLPKGDNWKTVHNYIKKQIGK